MNKENMVKNISLLNRKKSPTPNKAINPQISFKNISNKSFYKNKNRDYDDLSLSPIGSKRLKTNTFKGQSSMLQTEMSESIISSHNSTLAEAFKLERQSLMNTLKIYKEQIDVMNHEQAKSKKEINKFKSCLKQKDESLNQLTKKNAEMSRKVYEYENMLPKLIELEQLQQKIIAQNNGLKSKLKIQQALLTNVSNISKHEEPKTPALEKIHSLTQTYISSNVSLKKTKEK